MNGGVNVELTKKMVPNNKLNYLVILIDGGRTGELFGTVSPLRPSFNHLCQNPASSLYAPPSTCIKLHSMDNMPLKGAEAIKENRKWPFKYFATIFSLGAPDSMTEEFFTLH